MWGNRKRDEYILHTLINFANIANRFIVTLYIYLFEFSSHYYSKPQYTPAIGLPLNLFQCDFRNKTCRRTEEEFAMEAIEGDELISPKEDVTENVDAIPDMGQWIYNEENLQKLIENVQSEWTQFSIK